MAKLFGRWGYYEPRTPEEHAKARRQERARRAEQDRVAEWLERTRWCSNRCGKEAAREGSPGHQRLRYSGACSPECQAAVELRWRCKRIYLDTETTGLNSAGEDELLEIAIVDDAGDALIDTLVEGRQGFM